MGGQIAKQKSVIAEEKQLKMREQAQGTNFPGSNYQHPNHKEWMATLQLDKMKVRDLVWPGTHDSATNRMGFPGISRPFAQCQKLSIYQQLVKGARVLDIRVQENRKVCHGPLTSYQVGVVVNDIKKFLAETKFEFLILEIRTGCQHLDPPNFDQWLIEQLGDYLILQDEKMFDKPLLELLPKRIFCVWKPRKAPVPSPGSPLWSSAYLKDDWMDTDLPLTKFNCNLDNLGKQPPNDKRSYFYRVENTATPQVSGPVMCVYPVTNRIRGYARLFVSEAFRQGLGDRLQVFVEDFVEKDFIDTCIGVTIARFSKEPLIPEQGGAAEGEIDKGKVVAREESASSNTNWSMILDLPREKICR